MPSSESVTTPVPNRTRASGGPRHRWDKARGLLGGGIDGNKQLTAMTGVILIVLLAALGITILQIGQLIWLHLFLGLLLLGPVLLKVGSTGYRFMRYYARDAIYVAKGPPMLALRAMGPLLVLSTLVAVRGSSESRHAPVDPQGELLRLAGADGPSPACAPARDQPHSTFYPDRCGKRRPYG